jgi:acyl-coenzyme A thioesterase PaaI-like protein
MTTIDSVLRRALDDRSGELVLTLDPAFQGLPDTAHGGSVLAAFDALAGLGPPREVRGVYHKRVPLRVPLALKRVRVDAALECQLFGRDGTLLVTGRVAPAADVGHRSPGPGPLRDPLLLGIAGRHAHETSDGASVASVVAKGARARTAVAAHPLPVSRACFACGVDNALGLRAQLEFDDEEVRGAWKPHEPFRTAGGTLTTAALTALCDEAAFWIGALATGEAGMTTDLAVTLHRAVPFGGPLTITGARAAARPQADPRYWDTEVAARTGDAVLVASARMTFVVVRGAARTLARGLLAINDPAVVARVFPAYAR